MKNCNFCGKPLRKEGRTEHYGCRALRKTMKKSVNVIEADSTDFNEACKTLDRNPELFNQLFTKH